MSVEVTCLKILSVNFIGEALMNGRTDFTLYLKVLQAFDILNSLPEECKFLILLIYCTFLGSRDETNFFVKQKHTLR